MSLTELLEIAIALVFLYLLFSQITLSLWELYAGVANRRGKFLYDRLSDALGKESTRNLYATTPIQTLYRKEISKTKSGSNAGTGDTGTTIKGRDQSPTYISAEVFAQAVLTLAAPNPTPEGATTIIQNAPEDLQKYVKNTKIPDGGELHKLLQELLQNAAITGIQGTEAQRLTQNLIDWYTDFQERLTGRYKRDLRIPLFLIGLGLAIICNVDTLQIVSYLRTHPADRQQAVAVATQFVKSHPDGISDGIPRSGLASETPAATASQQRIIARYVDSLATSLQQQGMPIGWWRMVTLDTTANDEKGNPVEAKFSIVKPGGLVMRLPSTFQEFDTEKMRTATSAMEQVLKGEWSKYKEDLTAPENACKEAELAQHPPINEAKFTTAETLTRRAVNTVVYLQMHYPQAAKEAKLLYMADSALLAQLQKARPVRQQYAPFYVNCEWKPADTLSSLCNDVALRNGTWQRSCSQKQAAGFPLVTGQSQLSGATFDWLWSPIGWLLTGLAMMVGAPFWFDLLGRFVNIRNVGTKPS